VRLAVVGDPVDHSLSPAIQAAALHAAGIAGSYTTMRVDAAGMAGVAESIRRADLDGVNVTMPHKALAAGLVDGTAGAATRTGSVNTITRVGERLVGHNTDVTGVCAAWGDAGLPVDRPVLVLGGGGAAGAALVAIEMLGAGPVRLAGRRGDVLRALVASVGVAASIEPIEEADAEGAVVVNATPLGMHGESLPVDVRSASGLLDLTYRAATSTPAVAAARDAGIPVADGVAMVIAQAAGSFRLWTGREADVAAMATAAGAELARRAGSPVAGSPVAGSPVAGGS
jgi:shikimate dehydrogenase